MRHARASGENRSSGRDGAEEVHACEQPADLYAVLGVSVEADTVSIAAAFRRLIKTHHPDVNRDRSSAQARQIVAAYRILTDPGARARYDAGLMLARPAANVERPPAALRSGRTIGRKTAAALLAAGGLAAALLLPPSGRDIAAQQSVAASVPRTAEPRVPTAEWLVGAWVREHSPCAKDSVTVFHPDSTWSATGAHGRWRIDENKLLLEPVAGAVPTGADAPWEVERIVSIAPNEFRTFSGRYRVQRTFDRCGRSG